MGGGATGFARSMRGRTGSGFGSVSGFTSGLGAGVTRLTMIGAACSNALRTECDLKQEPDGECMQRDRTTANVTLRVIDPRPVSPGIPVQVGMR